jgi:hypothetical protein
MDLLERYLQAVRFFLPRKQQDDIIRELSENLILADGGPPGGTRPSARRIRAG